MATTTPPALPDPIGSELRQLLRALKLGKLLDTLRSDSAWPASSTWPTPISSNTSLGRRDHPPRHELGLATRPRRRPGTGHAGGCQAREKAGRAEDPTAAVLDTQSIRRPRRVRMPVNGSRAVSGVWRWMCSG